MLQLLRGDVALPLLLAEAEEHEVVGGGRVEPGRVERVCDPSVHHLHGVSLPEQHLLDGVVGRNALGVQGNHDVNGESAARNMIWLAITSRHILEASQST